MAGGRRPPSLPGPGSVHNLLSFPGGTSTAQKTALPSSLLTHPPQRVRAGLGGERGPGSGGSPGGRAAPPPAEPALLACLRRRLGRSAGRGARTQMHRPLFGRRGTHRLLAGLPSPPLSPVPSPRAPRTGAHRPGTRRGRRGPFRRAGRGRAPPPAGVQPATPRGGGFRGSPSPEPPAAPLPSARLSLGLFQKGERWGRPDREVGEKVACLLGCWRGATETRRVPVCSRRSGVWG